MSDWQKDLHDFNKGFTDSAESRMPLNRLNQDMQMGRRAAGHDQSDSNPPAPKGGDVWSGLTGLLGLAGFIAGLLLGANFLDKGWVGVLIMVGSAVLGFVAGAAPIMLLQSGMRAIYEKILWRRQGKDNTAQSLMQFWEARFGAPPAPELVDRIEHNGSAWILDARGNFILQMKNGGKLFVGHDPRRGI